MYVFIFLVLIPAGSRCFRFFNFFLNTRVIFFSVLFSSPYIFGSLARVAGDLDSIYHTHTPRGRKCFFYVFVFNDLCDNRSEEAYPHIKANNVTLYHIMPRKIYYTWVCNFFSTFVLFCV